MNKKSIDMHLVWFCLFFFLSVWSRASDIFPVPGLWYVHRRCIKVSVFAKWITIIHELYLFVHMGFFCFLLHGILPLWWVVVTCWVATRIFVKFLFLAVSIFVFARILFPLSALYLFMDVCVCLCVCVRERRKIELTAWGKKCPFPSTCVCVCNFLLKTCPESFLIWQLQTCCIMLALCDRDLLDSSHMPCGVWSWVFEDELQTQQQSVTVHEHPTCSCSNRSISARRWPPWPWWRARDI